MARKIIVVKGGKETMVLKKSKFNQMQILAKAWLEMHGFEVKWTDVKYIGKQIS